MKEQIIEQLKSEYASFGLGDKALNGLAEFAETSVETAEDIPDVVKSLSGLAKSFQSEADQIRTAKSLAEKRAAELEEKIKVLGAKPVETIKPNEPINDYEAKIAALIDERLGKVQNELESFKNKEAQAKRTAFINAEAERLGIPSKFISFGFNISDDADEIAITTKLNEMATEIKTLSAPQSKVFTPTITTQVEVTAEKRAEILKRIKH